MRIWGGQLQARKHAAGSNACAKGYTHAELAERMNISRNTVPAHIKNINRELAANVRTI